MTLQSLSRHLLSSGALLIALVLISKSAGSQDRPLDNPRDRHHRNQPIASTQQLSIGGATLQIDFTEGALDLKPTEILPWIRRAADAVTIYYGHFPVAHARVLIVPVPGRRGIVQGTTWAGNPGGHDDSIQAMSRLLLGQHSTVQDLTEDWTMTHELVHMAFPSLPDDQHWMEEGLATYIEPIARVQAGELDQAQVWHDMMDGMPKGQPEPGDRGIDNTHTWGRTYWGGALFCLNADVQIRRQTNNQKGLQDALRAIVAAGGTIDHDWPLDKAIQIGDKATGTTVLSSLYKKGPRLPSPRRTHPTLAGSRRSRQQRQPAPRRAQPQRPTRQNPRRNHEA